MAAVDYFLKIDGISGESTDDKHKGEIEVESFSWGVTNTTLTRAGGGAGAGRAQFQDLAFNTRVSKASPSLFLKCATGEHIKQAVLTATTMDAKGQSQEFLKITLSDVLVSSYQSSGQATVGQSLLQPPTDAAFIGPVDTIGIIGPELPADSGRLRYASLKFTEGTPTSVGVQPTVGGALRFDLKTNTVVAYPDGPEIIVGVVEGGIQRAVREYDVTSLMGLLTAPLSTARLHLDVTEIRGSVNPGPPGINSVTASTKSPGPPQVDVILYTPADGTLDASDLTRGGKKVGRITVDPSADPASVVIDLTDIVRRRGLETFGIRLQAHGLDLPEPFEEPEDSAQADSEGDDHEDDAPRAPFSASFSFHLVLENQ